MLVAWVLCPLALALLCLGLGLVVERAASTRLPRSLLPGAGLAALVVCAQLGVGAGLGAGIIVAGLLALAVSGLALGVARLPIGRAASWPCAAAAAVFAAYAAPIVLSGEATFAGYRRLDDTATWLAITDHVLANGRDLSGLAPSSHEATLAYTLGRGYPVGALLPLGVLAELTRQDPAWLIQPYMAALAAILALSLWALCTPLREAPALRALAVATAASAALLYGHYLSGAAKELLAAALLATGAGVAAHAGGALGRRLLPLALTAIALAATLSFAGAIWIAPAIAVVVLAARTSGRRPHGWALAAVAAAAVALLSLLLGGWLSPLRRAFTGDAELGNLFGSLELQRLAGIWPAADFRSGPELEPLAFCLIGLAAGAAVWGFALAWRVRATGLLAYAGGALGIAFCVYLVGSPWLAAKALAIASPAVLLLAVLAAGAAVRARAVWGSALAAALVGGVIWSNALAGTGAQLAPRSELAELERIGEEIAGEGPTLLAAYEPYGGRHFLRRGDPDGVGDLRRRRVPLRGGGIASVPRSVSAARIRPGALGAYRTLVIDRFRGARPPAPYERVIAGERYEVWQRASLAVERTRHGPEAAAPLARWP